MRLIQYALAILLISCEGGYSIPDKHSGRYYGVDSIFRSEMALEKNDTIVRQIYLDVISLDNGLYDVQNDDGYWVRDGFLDQGQFLIDISGFQGDIYLINDSLILSASFTDNLISVTHRAYLTK